MPLRRPLVRLLLLAALTLCACTPSAASPTAASSPSAPTAPPTAAPTTAASAPIPTYSYRVINTYPHDPAAFTEGLVFFNGDLYESTGLAGQSSLRQVALATGVVLRSQSLAPNLFGEGLTVFDNRLIQLTWQSHVGYVYRLDDFAALGQFNYTGEGWGLTQDGQRLIMSDGSSTLRFLDPQTFAETGRLLVRANGADVTLLNELEFVDGQIYANIWKTDRIARIDPHTGQVVGWIDLSGLISLPPLSNPEAVLNGIAYDPARQRLFVTGKLWPRLFEITLSAPAP